ncbi:DUF6420 family protein [Streptomyces stelliscabiei]
MDQDLPLIHPYAPVTPRRYVTPGGAGPLRSLEVGGSPVGHRM